MAIEIIGAVYCPLSPRDPEQRLHALVKETTALVLLHWMTHNIFGNHVSTLDLDSVLDGDGIVNDGDLERLSGVLVTPASIAYTIFTSGSTGTPKAVSASSG